MQRFWSWLAVELGRRAGLVSIVGLVVTVALGLGITQLEFATGQDSYLNKGDQVAKDNVAYQDLFGGQIMIVLFTMEEGSTVVDLTTGENRETILEATEEIAANPNVESVVTPLTGLEFSDRLIQNSYADPSERAGLPTESVAGTVLQAAIDAEEPGSEEQILRYLDQDRTACRLLGIANPLITPEQVPDERREPCDEPGFDADGDLAPEPDVAVLTNPEWVDFLLHDNTGEIRKSLRTFFPDDTHAQMIVRLKGNADIEVEGAGAVAVKEVWEDREIEGAELTVTGAPVLLKDINDYLKGGILRLGAIAVAIMVLILLVLFDVRWRLLPLAVVLVGVIWAFGLAGYLGIPLSVVTIAGLPVMLGVGIDYAIQMHARIEEEVVIDRASHPIQETARNLGPALLVVTFDAVFAFAALRFAKVPMIRDFALLLCIGVAVICLGSIILPLAALGIREYRSPTTGRDFREGALGRLTVWLGSLSPRVAPPLMAASLVIFVGGIVVEDKLTLQTDPVQWVNQESQNRKDIATLEEEVDSSSELGIYVTGETEEELFTDENVEYLHSFTNETLAEYPDLLNRASSILTPISFLTEIEGTSDVAPTGEQIRTAYEAAPDAVKTFTVANTGDDHAMNILFTTRPSSLDERAEMVNEIRETADPPGDVRATPSGLAVVGVGLLENLESNRVLLTYLSILFVFLFLTVRLRSIVRSLLSLVPVLIAVGAASLVAFALSLKLSPMTAVGGPLVIAVCTEFTSLILLRFLEERKRGLTPQAAADVVAARTGRAFIVSAMTAIVGVGVIATSSLPLLRDFGIIVAMNVLVALLSALVILPPVMVWAEQRGWVSRGMIDPEIIAHATKTHDESQPDTPDLGGAEVTTPTPTG
ncbi:MMPL family transporter [Iamia sp. SCSIO 61187]|uniref:efflux RND transporter permease subunit n=1 Tax=Iamia sp. SCSIO 61187 TaxID=2722752 RepID=UPI001C62F47B|nr:MMPL family transporter [Iamia sp. SCSIO 61187]QYG92310.1 MMPL family transporter [Iamia sp. SCSIO 61187]